MGIRSCVGRAFPQSASLHFGEALGWALARGWVPFWLAALIGFGLFTSGARGQDEAQAAMGPAWTIAVLLSTNTNRCYRSGYNAAIKKLSMLQVDRINARGGVGGRPIELKFLDDYGKADETIKNVGNALADPRLLAIVGLTSSDRGGALFKGSKSDNITGLSKEIAASGVPFITDMSVNRLFAHLPNVYSTRPSQAEGNAPIVSEFIKSNAGGGTVALIVNASRIYSRTFGEAVEKQLGPERVLAHYRVREERGGDKQAVTHIADSDVQEAIADIQAKAPSMVVIAVGSSRTAPIFSELAKLEKPPAIFMMGLLQRVPEDILNGYPNAVYALTNADLPEIHNATLGNLVTHGEPEQWIFAGKKNENAPGWANKTCEVMSEADQQNPFYVFNRRAIDRGAQFADMVALVAESASPDSRSDNAAERRKAILDTLSTKYTSGAGAFRGVFRNWSFDAGSRVAVRPLFVTILPWGVKKRRLQLAPVQFVPLRDGTLRQVDTLYVDIDLITANTTDANDRTFLAEFYLSMRANENADIDRLDFTNAFVNPRTQGRELIIEEIHDGSADPAYPDQMKIYRVSGKFRYKPDFATYPFDTQRFEINIKPRRGKAFLLQPPPLALRDRSVDSDDWQVTGQYVGISEDFLPVVDAYRHEPSVLPFYNASFVWLMKRQVNDYFLRVVVPLAFILVVAYVSIFIPRGHFEAIVTIQVTALLSAVALYLSLPQLDSDTATLSDRIFVYYYMLVSLMIVITILRMNPGIKSRAWLRSSLGMFHVVVIPLVVGLIALQIFYLSNATLNRALSSVVTDLFSIGRI